jgi:hypothetical protein
MSWGAVAGAAVSVVGGMMSSDNASGRQGDAMAGSAEAARRADPFASERPYYQKRLKELQEDPSSYLDNPAYKSILNSTLDASGRALSARGYYGSGNYDNELIRSGNRVGLDYVGKEKDFLAKLAGGYAEPGYAGSAYASGLDEAARAGEQSDAAKMYGYGAIGDLAKQYVGGLGRGGSSGIGNTGASAVGNYSNNLFGSSGGFSGTI